MRAVVASRPLAARASPSCRQVKAGAGARVPTSGSTPQRCLPSPTPLKSLSIQHAQAASSRRIRISAQAVDRETNGAASNDNTDAKSELSQTVEMFVAHSAGDSTTSIIDRARRMAKRIVPTPFTSKPPSALAASSTANNTSQTGRADLAKVRSQEESSALAALAARQSRALQAELSMTSAELREKNRELQEAQSLLRKKDGQVSGLKAMLAEKDKQVKNARVEIVEARMQIQEKDIQLQSALEQLTTAARERAKLRQDLIVAQTELRDTRSELERWTVHLNELKSVMESVDLESFEEEETAFMLNGYQQPNINLDDDEYFEILSGLSELASELAQEAAQDELIYKQIRESLCEDEEDRE